MSETPWPARNRDTAAAFNRRITTLERAGTFVPVVTADPAPLAAGHIWIRSDTGQLCWYDGAAVRRISGA